MYKESQHMKFLLQKREAPSSQDQEPPGAPGTPSTGPALALVRGNLHSVPAVTSQWYWISKMPGIGHSLPAIPLAMPLGEAGEFPVASGLRRMGGFCNKLW